MLIDPRHAGPRPPFYAQQQPAPGKTSAMNPVPDHGEKDYKGTGLFTGAAALITGGDSGIGRAIALGFAREGADVLISYLDEHEDALATSKLIEQAGRRAVLIPGDIGNEPHCNYLVAQCVAEFGRIDVLVNNAAFQRTHPSLEDISAEEIQQTFKTNIA